MVTIYYGRECLNKEQFMFNQIAAAKGRSILLVPDQFTLQAEKEAFHYLQTNGLMDLEVLSLSRLGARILAQTGGSRKTPVDERGRYMLMAKIIDEQQGKLKLYKNGAQLSSFAQMANDLIYEMKQYNTNAQSLATVIEDIHEDSILKRKLMDIQVIYEQYESYMQEKYLDGEDYIALFTEKMAFSTFVGESNIWIYGFDYFTPKNLRVLEGLMRHGQELNMVMTYDADGRDADLFELTGQVMAAIERMSKDAGIAFAALPVPAEDGVGNARQGQTFHEGQGQGKAAGLTAIEQEIFATPAQPYVHGGDQENVILVKAANPYSEMESAAAYVLELVRDQGLLYKDIAIICNDMDVRASIAKRVFSEYGIELFLDKKRNFMQNAVIRFLVSLLNLVSIGLRNADLFCMLKTGFVGLREENIEELEIYARKYRIKGNMWRHGFAKGAEEYGEALERIEETRETVMEFLSQVEKPYKRAKTVGEKTEVLCRFLIDDAHIPEKLEKMADNQVEKGLYELAEETAQIWSILVNLFDQLVELLGNEKLPDERFTDVLRVGLEAVEVGLLPPTADGLLMGTMQRIRIGRVQALLVVGADDTLIPSSAAREGLISDDEKTWLLERGVEICRREELRMREERIAIYRNLSKPRQYLWMSYAISDEEGNKKNASQIWEKIREIFPDCKPQADIISAQSPIPLTQTQDSSLLHLSAALREAADHEVLLAEPWQAVMDWHKEKNARNFKLLTRGLLYRNSHRPLPRKQAKELYAKPGEAISLSPSRLEKYGRCPFAHFVAYGIRPSEPRIYEIGGREIGDIYHNCLMRFSMELTDPSHQTTAPESRWMAVTQQECEALIGQIVEEETGQYKEGMFAQNNEALYRAQRIKEICTETAWQLVSHVRCGKIKTMDFEKRFGRYARQEEPHFLPIEIELKKGERVFIEGKIDRVDVLADGSVKVIDYKSGSERFRAAEARAGWRLQLMLYLKAASGGHADPAGIFYFLIDEQAENGRMDGVVVDKPSVIENIAGEFERYSEVIPVLKLADGRIKGNSQGNLMGEEEFRAFQEEVDEVIRTLCERLAEGFIMASPKRSGSMSACTYCDYRSICFFDLAFEGCGYEVIRG